MKFRKKPVVIDAIQWTGRNFGEVTNFMGVKYASSIDELDAEQKAVEFEEVIIDTREGRMIASKNDFIIKGVVGEFYPCKPDIFAATYELVEEEVVS